MIKIYTKCGVADYHFFFLALYKASIILFLLSD